MKRKRWISIELEHRETTVTIRHSAAYSTDSKDGQPQPTAPSCSVCGCNELLPLNALLTAHSGSQADLSRALTAGDLHLVAEGDELRLCQRSFERFRERMR